MRLTFEEIRAIAVGALTVEEQDDGIHFEKMTKKQIEAFSALSDGFRERALATTGVRLDFHTNSRSLAFSTSGGRKFELYIDGLLSRQFDCDVLRESGEIARAELRAPLGDRDEVRVTLIFPSHEIGVLEFLELDDGAKVTPHRFERKMLFIGDSITQGWNSDYDSFSYAWRITRFFDAESVIQGIGGAYFHENFFDHLPYDPDTVIVALGTNDFGFYTTQEEMHAHVSAHLSLIAEEYADKRIFVISPIWRKSQIKPMGHFDDARRIVIEEAKRLGLRHIDGYRLVPHMSEFMADQTLHPNDLGFSLYAENLIAEMLK